MHFAIDIPNFGAFADPHLTADVARDAEAAGWDAVWVWDHTLRDRGVPYADPWILLAAIALATTRVRLGPMVTPLPGRRPWSVARKAVTLDHLSGGRFTLGIGLGAPAREFSAVGEEADPKIRAAKLDEGLAIVGQCWTGETFSFHGQHYRLDDVEFLPRPLQQPRIPVWLGATWPIPAPFRRAARWDGVWPLRRNPDGITMTLSPEDVRDVLETVAKDRAAAGRPVTDPFDVLIHGTTPADDPAEAAAIVRPYAEAGATWWTERINPSRGSLDDMRRRIAAGPPRLQLAPDGPDRPDRPQIEVEEESGPMTDLSRKRMAAQLLSGPPASSVVDVVERLLAVQAQDPRGARLAIRARSAGLAAGDVDRALTQDRALLVSWLNRGTLHLVRREDYPWLHQLTTPQLVTGNTRRLAQEGVTPTAADSGVATLARALEDEGPLTRDQLRVRISAAGVRTEGQALVHILGLASLRGLIIRGPMIGRDQAFVLVRDWLGEIPVVDRDRALGWMARRYLAGHGPADERDLAKWAGLTIRDAIRGLRAIGSDLVQRDDGLVDLLRADSPEGVPPPRLLGAYEPLLLGWRSREDFVPSHRERLIADNGLFRPFALVSGRAAGTWTLRSGAVSLDPFEPLAPGDSAALAADAADVVRFLGGAAPG